MLGVGNVEDHVKELPRQRASPAAQDDLTQSLSSASEYWNDILVLLQLLCCSLLERLAMSSE